MEPINALGRRKAAVARVYLSDGKGKITVNGRDYKEYFGAERTTSVSRELSKMFEETVTGPVEEVLSHFLAKEVKGEIVIVVAGKSG